MLAFPVLTSPISLDEFYLKFLVRNLPCLLDRWITDQWPARQFWCTETGEVNIRALFERFPKEQILCVADCSRSEFGAHQTLELSVLDFTTYWEASCNHQDDRLLYLKDWHYFKHVDEEFYQLPDLFASDWMNEFWNVRQDVQDDFRFVYLGVRNTWTPLHADVYQSYSWSANICGEKRWWFFPPGEEKKLCAFNNGHMPMDVRNLPLESTGATYFLIVQHPGQAVFVPSGWYHQVVNATNCLSINHNWFNATNVEWVWDHLQSQLASVEASTEDVRDTPGWHEQCQVCLRALAGINFQEFLILLKYILLTRWPNKSICLPLSSTCQSAQSDGDPDELTRLERVIDAGLLECLQSDIGTLRSLLQNPNSWRDEIQGFGVELVQRKLPQWIRLHDFTSVLQIIPLFLKHPVVERLQPISENPLNKHLTVL